jgi:hypothetical protein
MLGAISAMNNEVEFAALAHNLPLRKVTEGDDYQLHRNMISNVQVSPQAIRKTRFTSLNLECSWASNITTCSNTSILQEPEMDQSEDSNREPIRSRDLKTTYS